MFHAELRRFPHVTHAFNLSEAELQARILEAWRTGRTVELGDHRWVPDQTRLRILEGPELAPNELSLGRGWASAQRRATDVTERMLASAPAPRPVSASDRRLARELLGRASQGPLPLHEAWQFVHERRPEWAASDCLSAAEHVLGLLVREDLARVDDAPLGLPRDPAAWGEAGAVLRITALGVQALARERGET